MKFKFLRQPTALTAVALEAVEQKMEQEDDFKAGYLACYEDLVRALKDMDLTTLMRLQAVMGKLARKGKSL